MPQPSRPAVPYIDRVRAQVDKDVEYAMRQGFEGASLIAWSICLAGRMISDSADAVSTSLDNRG